MSKFSLGYSSKIHKLADMLGLSKGQVASADLPCGYTCPAANICLSRAHRVTGKIRDGKNTDVRCYGASLESAFTALRNRNWRNFMSVWGLSVNAMTDVLLASIDDWLKVLRLQSFGDFFNKDYFNAWVNVTEKLPKVQFFGYTKVIEYVNAYKPDNFSLVYSFGGKFDHLRTNEPTAYIIRSHSEAEELGIPVSCENHPADDYLFIRNGQSFGLMIHGTQPKKT